MSIHQDIILKVRGHVVNQARYIYPTSEYPDQDEMYEAADELSDEDTAKFLAGKAIVGTDNLWRLAEKITVADLFDEDAWVDPVADYIMEHKEDCTALWESLRG